MEHIVKDVFGIVDYIVFAIMLLISAGIGVWYAIVDRKKTDTQEFLMGGRSLSVFPVAMSVLASFMSAITLLGTPAEVYRYGTQYMIINIAFCLVIPATAYLYLPVFFNLGVTSAYEYLELRFHSAVRTIGCIVFTLHMLMYMPVVLYAPALALSEVTGIRIWTAVLSIGLVCTFYTSIGGMKAVVWTDFFQSLMMYGSILVIVVKGTIDLGGFDVVWQRSFEGGRIEFWSTVSSGVNSLAAVMLEDIIKKFIVKDISELWATRISKALAMSFGVISIVLVFVAEQMGGVLQAALTIHGIVGGPMLGAFTLGMFIPFANTWGASTGLVSGFGIAMWFGMGSFASHPYHPEASLSYQGCAELYYNATSIDIANMTSIPEIIRNNDDILPPYRLSYLWLSGVGFVVVMIVGVVVSLITRSKEEEIVDERLLSPLITWLSKYMPGGKFKEMVLHKEKRGMSQTPLRTTSVISDSDFYPTKKASISYISDSKLS
ncbi:Sodium-coupled monocarboxylate transporter 1 [Araneus ventricosus]|uniref:Sodium-coupled monocarboxylate transporter 1 n=1 Tax=Araneus ventricosus TaxID=182803 RepID=A0A4Y2IYG2_ARAVE|nr:Sodium-coupled monocarboxylate transporter 1 [Araneus ventricosus]